MTDTRIDEKAIDLDAFIASCEQTLDPTRVPRASQIINNIPVYDAHAAITAGDGRVDIMDEWAWNLRDGSGVVVLAGAYNDTTIIDQATDVFNEILDAEAAAGKGAGDHFAKAGANGRIWNSIQKLALHSPDIFAQYHSNRAIDMMAQAWLGPHYQMTAQLNLVRPGGAAQSAHRDYHLGFMTNAEAARFPLHVHQLSAYLTLQGGIAHVDIAPEAGSTYLLPFSQHYDLGYLAYRDAGFSEYFDKNYVQIPMNKGDAIFFNPALFHAGGANQTADIQRMVNLLQISSAMGRPMEIIDNDAMCRAVYPQLVGNPHKLDDDAVIAAVMCCAEGYAFPTNLDNDPPIGGMAPKSQVQIMLDAIAAGDDADAFGAALDALKARRLP